MNAQWMLRHGLSCSICLYRGEKWYEMSKSVTLTGSQSLPPLFLSEQPQINLWLLYNGYRYKQRGLCFRMKHRHWKAGTIFAGGDRLRSAKELEVAREAGKQSDSCSEADSLTAARSHAAVATRLYAAQCQALVHTTEPPTCWCSELWCVQTTAHEGKGYLCS